MSHFKPIIVFLADDDQDDISIFNDALGKIGFDTTLTIFNHGKEVCEHIQNSLILPDIIFLDINMPLMNGKECLIEIRKNRMFDDVVVIMFSTGMSQAEIKETYDNGANLYVRKPSSFKLQMVMLKEILGNLIEMKLWNLTFEEYTFKISSHTDSTPQS